MECVVPPKKEHYNGKFFTVEAVQAMLSSISGTIYEIPIVR